MTKPDLEHSPPGRAVSPFHDPEWRVQRAAKGGRASHTTVSLIGRLERRRHELTESDIRRLATLVAGESEDTP